jgi:hypothetical protein
MVLTLAVIKAELTSVTPLSLSAGFTPPYSSTGAQGFGRKEVGKQNLGEWHQIGGECRQQGHGGHLGR